MKSKTSTATLDRINKNIFVRLSPYIEQNIVLNPFQNEHFNNTRNTQQSLIIERLTIKIIKIKYICTHKSWFALNNVEVLQFEAHFLDQVYEFQIQPNFSLKAPKPLRQSQS